MVSKEILNSHSVGTLKKEISKTNIKGYSKLKKAEIIELMLKSKEKFMHIEMKEKSKRQMKKKKEEGTHTMPDGTVMSGESHGEDSKPVKKKKIKLLKKEEPKKERKKIKLVSFDKKEEPKKLTERIKEFNKKYNANEIKKQKLDKSNLKKYTDPYFKELEEIEKMLSDIDDNIKFIKDNKELSSTFTDIKKNFVRRVKSNMKKQKANKK